MAKKPSDTSKGKKPTPAAPKAGVPKASAAKPSKAVRAARPSALVDTRVVYCGDNLEQLANLPDGCVDLVYIDPPFNSNRNYEVFWGETKEKRSFEDRHASTQAYIDYMRPRCVQLARVLKETGSFYYHCDWHASHYVKVMLDQIFGENNYQNEIIWQRTFAHGNAGRSFGNVTDSIFYYVRSEDYTWNPVYGKFTPDYIDQRFSSKDKDGRRWQSVTLRNPSQRPNLHYPFKASNGVVYEPHPNGWSCDRTRMEKYDKENRLHFPKPGGQLRLKMYLDESPGPLMQNLWDDIPPINSQAKEDLGYPTQKPLALLDRIINASSNKNDIVLDAFCGCGTALVAAQNLGRQWIGIDISPTACRVMAKRLKDVCHMRESEPGHRKRDPSSFIVRNLPWTIEKLKAIPPFEFENWAVIQLGGIPNVVQVGDMGIDGRIFPVGTKPADQNDMFAGDWFPVQVKQVDKVGRPDIDAFEAAMTREDRQRGFMVAFGFSSDAIAEAAAFFKKSKRVIKLITVQEILDEQHVQKM